MEKEYGVTLKIDNFGKKRQKYGTFEKKRKEFEQYLNTYLDNNFNCSSGTKHLLFRDMNGNRITHKQLKEKCTKLAEDNGVAHILQMNDNWFDSMISRRKQSE